MKIALIGHGNMGKEIEQLVSEDRKHQIVSTSSLETSGLDLDGIKKADVVIDFTAADAVLENVSKVSALGKNMVIGTTGWYDSLREVENIVKKAKIGLIYGQNFSIGANVYFKIIAFASKLFAKFKGYDVYGLEVHHKGKKDSPSGTARRIAQAILENFPAKLVLQTEKLDRQIEEGELHFASVRGGRNFGYHEVVFDSAADEIKLSHSAHSRRGFAEGAILAAEFIEGKKGLYTFDELFKM